MPSLRDVRAKLLSDATEAGLQTKLDDFLAAKGTFSAESPERQFIDIQYEVQASNFFTVLVVYTE